jgi:hypothetical protein
MSHHFDLPPDEEPLDISDAYCFAGASDSDGPRTVFGVNVSPKIGAPWSENARYELRLDTNGDYLEDITWRFTFPIDSSGTQQVVVEQLTGTAASDPNAKGTIITPRNAPVGQVLNLAHGIKVFAGKRRDSFFNYLPLPFTMRQTLFDAAAGNVYFPDMDALIANGAKDDFLDDSVRAVIVEAPTGITGRGKLHFWATVSIYDQGHGMWHVIQRAASPLVNVVYNWAEAGPKYTGDANNTSIDYNNAVPSEERAGRPANPTTDPATGIWGLIRDITALVVQKGGTYNQGRLGKSTALAYGAFVADTFLPNVLTFTPGTNARWAPWEGTKNGKGLLEQSSDQGIQLILNKAFDSKLRQPGQLLDYLPYLAEPLPEPPTS